jgi:hypothetical protein
VILIALMMEAARTSETLETSTRLHGATTQKTAIFVLIAVRTSNSTSTRLHGATTKKTAWNHSIVFRYLKMNFTYAA